MFQGFNRAGFLVPLLVCAAGAFGQSSVTNSYDINVNNQIALNSCSTGEPVALDGTVHIDASVNTDDAGVNHFAVKAAGNLMGTGQTTGIAYMANDSDEYSSDVDDSSADLTVELKSDLKPQGQASSLTLVQRLHIVVDTRGNISAQVVSNSASCGT